MPQKNYSCENSDSCSLMSVTSLNTCSESKNVCSESKSRSRSISLCPDSRSLCPDSSSLCPESRSLCPDSSSLCPESRSLCPDSRSGSDNSCVTYSDKTSCSASFDRSSRGPCDRPCEKPCERPCDRPCVLEDGNCEVIDNRACDRLVKRYNCSREELLAVSDIIVMLNFIKSKLSAVRPNILERRTEKYTVQENIVWIESFIDTLFCVLRKNEAYKVIKVRVCKLKNDSDEVISNRTYLLKVKFNTRKGCITRNIPITFYWTHLTNNLALSYNKVLDISIRNIGNEITALDASSVRPFLQENVIV